MFPMDIMFLANQMRHRELIQEAERERLFKSALKKRQGNRGSGLNIIERTWTGLPKYWNSAESTHEQLHLSDPCCTAAEGSSG